VNINYKKPIRRYDTIVKKHPNISRGTVYRNLNLFSDIGEIRKVEMPNGADRFDHLCHEHYHARCVKCGRVFDVEMEFIADLEKNIKDTYGFEITGHDVIFKGTCLECNRCCVIFSAPAVKKNKNVCLSDASAIISWIQANSNMCAYGSIKTPP